MPNERILRVMREKNVPPIQLPKLPEPIILAGIDDPRLPAQIANDIRVRKDISEIALFPAYKNFKNQFRITLKKSNDYNVCIFYI